MAWYWILMLSLVAVGLVVAIIYDRRVIKPAVDRANARARKRLGDA